MKMIEQLRATLERIGATLDDRSDYTLNCDAPSGYVWNVNELPSYAIHYATPSQSWLSKAIREEMPALRLGLNKVTDSRVLEEIRHNLDEDDWGAPPDAPAHIKWPE